MAFLNNSSGFKLPIVLSTFLLLTSLSALAQKDTTLYDGSGYTTIREWAVSYGLKHSRYLVEEFFLSGDKKMVGLSSSADGWKGCLV